jgi:hypothetical protein
MATFTDLHLYALSGERELRLLDTLWDAVPRPLGLPPWLEQMSRLSLIETLPEVTIHINICISRA